jgi:tRNA(Ile)-lysidine synthase
LVALSGGSDSVALLHLMHELQREGDLSVVGVAHLNHQLRGAESDQDETFCRAVAASLSLPIVAERVDVAAAAHQARRSLEPTARDVRYAFLHRAAVSLEADRIAVGHTRNDQAETFLLRLIRGAGPVGLAGIHPRAGIVVRPLLDVEREELREYLMERGVEFREDTSNLDLAIPRNRVRHELLPLLRDRFSPSIVRTLSREADIAREDAQYLDELVARAETGLIHPTADGLVIDVRALRACPAALARRILRRAMRHLGPDQFVGFDAVESVLDLADDLCQVRQVDVPGHRAERCGETIVLRSRHGRALAGDESKTASFSYPLEVPGEVALPEVARQISAELAESGVSDAAIGGAPDRVVVAAATLAGPLTVRSRHQGDVFRPLGLRGRKKLQDFFVDRKVRRAERDRVPLVVDSRNRIVWVAGYAVGEEFRVSDPSKPVVILRMTHLGGEG